MTINTTAPVEKVDPAEAARANLKAARKAYDKASARWTTLSDTIDAAEARLAKGEASLAKYHEHLDAEVAEVSAKLILQGRELKIPEPLARKLADRDRLNGEMKILSDGLGALKENLKTAYAAKREQYEKLDDAAAAVLRAVSEPLAMRLAALREEERTLAQRLRAFQHASIVRKPAEFYIQRRDLLGQLGAQLLRAVEEPLRLDDVGAGAHAGVLVDWHQKLIADASVTLPDKE